MRTRGKAMRQGIDTIGERARASGMITASNKSINDGLRAFSQHLCAAIAKRYGIDVKAQEIDFAPQPMAYIEIIVNDDSNKGDDDRE